MEIYQSNNPKSEAAKKLSEFLRGGEESGVLLLVSGGSSFTVLEHVPIDVLGPHMTLGMLDERYSYDETINNFSQLRRLSFFERASEADVSIIDSSILNNESLEDMADRLDTVLKEWVVENKEGKIVIVAGIGSDGHTGGIMPFPENKAEFERLFMNRERFVVGYNAGDKNQYPERVTVTASFIQAYVDKAVCLVTGESKRAALLKASNASGELNETPALLLQSVPEVALFTDLKL